MNTYFRTHKAIIRAAKVAKKENYNTILEYSSAQCDCGESFAIRLVDLDSGNVLETFVECEACYLQY